MIMNARRGRTTDRPEWVTREACEPYSVRKWTNVLLGANMGMSASDAAPLPRLGEIFFDVRGSSRSMRLSWYSNTGVAVFSIWQGGTCTGTFRLPMDDLTRLVDSLRRGVPGGPDEAGGPVALGGQRPRLAIGAAPAEPFTGMMSVLTEEQAAAYGRSNGRRTGGFATIGKDQGPGAGDQYSAAQLNGSGRLNGTGPQYEAGQQYAAMDQYNTGPQYNGTGQYESTGQYEGTGQAHEYGQYGQSQRYGAEAQDGQSRPGADGQSRDQRADYQYGTAQYGAQGQQAPGQQPTVQPGGYGAAARYQAPQQGESVPSYSTGPQPSYGIQSSAGQQSFADGQASASAYGSLGQAGGAQPGHAYQGGAPEESHGDDTGPRPVARYADEAQYGRPAAQSYEGRPSRDGESYDQAYPGQGYDQQGYQQPGYDEHGYDDQGYAAPGRTEQVQAGLESSAGTFGNRGYTMAGQEAAPASGQYQEYAYGQQDQPDAAAARARGHQGFGGQGPEAVPAYSTGPQTWQDAGYQAGTGAAQGYAGTGAAQGYPAGVGGGPLSAPVPPDNGAAAQQSPGASAAPFAAQPGGSYGTPAPEADRYAPSHGDQPGYPQPAGYQHQAAQPDAGRYQEAPSAGPGPMDGGASGYGAVPAAGQSGYQPAPAGTGNGYAYDQPGYGNAQATANGHGGGYGDAERGGTGAFPAGYTATSTPGTGAYPEASGANGYAANGQAANGQAANGYESNGYESNGYGAGGHEANGYQPNGYAANGPTASDYPANAPGGRAPAPSGAYPGLPANGNSAGYAANGNGNSAGYANGNGAGYAANGTASGNGHANGAQAPGAVPTFTPAFTANSGTTLSGETGGAGRPGQPAPDGYAPMPGYGAPQAGGAQAYPATPAHANGNGAGYPANGNNAGYAPNGNGNGQGYAVNGNGAGNTANGNGQGYAVNGDGAGYAANGNGYSPAANGTGYPSANGAAQANGYPRDGYSSGQPTDPMTADYPPAPGYAPVGQADHAQQGYWDQDQQPRGNWT